MVLAVVDGVMEPGDSRLAREPSRLEEPAEERDAVEEVAELCSDQRRGEEEEHGDERDAEPVAAHLTCVRHADDEHERDGESEAECRDRVERLRVEVRLVDGEVDDGAECDRGDSRNTQRAVQPRPGEPGEGDPDQRERKVERDELPPEARGDPAVMDVVELRRREARVGCDDRGAVEHEQHQHRPHLPRHAPQLSPPGGQLPAR